MVRNEDASNPGLQLSDDEEKLLKPTAAANKAKDRRDISPDDAAAAGQDGSEFPSILELKKALPAHCFQPTLTTSFYFVFRDLLVMSLLYIALLVVETYSPSILVNLVALPLYWYWQGTLMAGLFVLAHDCGHGSFSHSTLVNDAVGNVLNSMILVPYYPWKVSHNKHHKNTANIDKDEIFYPVREGESVKKEVNKTIIPLFGLGIGWFAYMVKGYAPRGANHLNPFDPMFVRHAVSCSISLACMAAWTLFALVPYYNAFGLVNLLTHYLVPVFVFASWLVLITFLHHHDEQVPWYSDRKWSFVKGQLSSVDRHYGIAHEALHNIGTHQIHHLFSKIPHYHVEEATVVFRERYPHLVRTSDEAIFPAFCRMFSLFNAQQWIRDDTEVHVFDYKRKRA